MLGARPLYRRPLFEQSSVEMLDTAYLACAHSLPAHSHPAHPHPPTHTPAHPPRGGHAGQVQMSSEMLGKAYVVLHRRHARARAHTHTHTHARTGSDVKRDAGQGVRGAAPPAGQDPRGPSSPRLLHTVLLLLTFSTPSPHRLHTFSSPSPHRLHTFSSPPPHLLHTFCATPSPHLLHTSSTPAFCTTHRLLTAGAGGARPSLEVPLRHPRPKKTRLGFRV